MNDHTLLQAHRKILDSIVNEFLSHIRKQIGQEQNCAPWDVAEEDIYRHICEYRSEEQLFFEIREWLQRKDFD